MARKLGSALIIAASLLLVWSGSAQAQNAVTCTGTFTPPDANFTLNLNRTTTPTPPPPPPAPSGGITAKPASALLNSIGFNTHIYVNPGLYSAASISAAFRYLGLPQPWNIRDYQYNAGTSGVYDALGGSISASTVMFGSACPPPAGNFDQWAGGRGPGNYAAWIAAHPAVLRYLEGSNETNNNPICWQDSSKATVATAAGSTVVHLTADTATGPFPMAAINAITAGTPGGASYGAGVIVTDSPNSGAIPANTTVVASTPTSVTLSNAVTGSGVQVGDLITFTANQAQQGQPGKANPASSVGWQAEMYHYAKYPGSPVASYPVLNFTDWAAGEPLNGAIGVPGTADFNNQHPYPRGGQQPMLTLFNPAQWANQGLFPIPNTPLVITEGGYARVQNGQNGVDAPTQAILLLNYFLDAFAMGVPNTYTYELYDNGCGAGDEYNNYGVFTNPTPPCTGSPKPAAIALKNLAAILADSGGSFTPGSLNYTISGLPAYNAGAAQGGGNSLLLQKSNGHYFLIVWNEPQIYNESSGEVTPPAVPIRINFGSSFGTVYQYDPQVSASVQNTYSNVSSINVSLVKDALIFELASGSTPPRSRLRRPRRRWRRRARGA